MSVTDGGQYLSRNAFCRQGVDRGVEITAQVNTNLFDRKMKYREWIGNNAVHGSNTEEEAIRDLVKLRDELKQAFSAKESETLAEILSSVKDC